MPIQKLADYRIVQIACGETFSLFVSDQNELFVSGMLEVDEDVYMQNRATFSVPHRIPFPEEIKRIAAGTRFALLLTVSGQVYQWGPDPRHPDSPSVSPVIASSVATRLYRVALGQADHRYHMRNAALRRLQLGHWTSLCLGVERLR